MNFTTNNDTTGAGSDLLPAGTNECLVKSSSMNVSKKGTEYFDVRFVIRNDVQQKYQNKYIFHSMYRRKEDRLTEADKQVDGFSFKQIMALAEHAHIPIGKNYTTLDDLGKDIINKPMLVEVAHKEWGGEDHVVVKFVNETKYPDCKHVYKEAAAPNNNQTYARKPQQQFAGQQTQPAVPTAPTIGNMEDFEEIISDSDLPF